LLGRGASSCANLALELREIFRVEGHSLGVVYRALRGLFFLPFGSAGVVGLVQSALRLEAFIDVFAVVRFLSSEFGLTRVLLLRLVQTEHSRGLRRLCLVDGPSEHAESRLSLWLARD